ncbi:MAG TPA: hypothetical protein VL523_07955 [Terriglobia bacterium]|nr:hypothetical protein [Terriglobia bacterium]
MCDASPRSLPEPARRAGLILFVMCEVLLACPARAGRSQPSVKIDLD